MKSLRDFAAVMFASLLGRLDARYGDALDVVLPGDEDDQ